MNWPSVSDLMPLAELSPALRPYVDPADAAGLRRIGYQPLWLKVCEGVIPAMKIGGRLFVQRSQVPDIAKSLGLKTVPVKAKPGRGKSVSSNLAAVSA